MGFGLEVQVNHKQLVRFLEELSARELPFATSVAMNNTAKQARDDLRRHVLSHKKITIRSKGLIGGIQHRTTHKREWPHLRVEIGMREQFWVHQETGGIKRARGGGLTAVPTRLLKRTKTGRISKPNRPKGLGAKATRAKVPGLDRSLVLKKPKRGEKRRGLYLLRPQVKILPQLGMRETVEKSARTWFNRKFEVAMKYAVRTSRERVRR